MNRTKSGTLQDHIDWLVIGALQGKFNLKDLKSLFYLCASATSSSTSLVPCQESSQPPN
jgi:hypothetical protein